MAMSKRDYEAIARILFVEAHNTAIGQFAEDGIARFASLRNAFADYLASDNPCFNRTLFIEACETGKCKGMRQA